MATPRRRRTEPQGSEQLSALDYRAQGNAASQNGDYNDAISCYTTAQDLDWREEDRQENIAAILLGRATAYYHLEQNDLALFDLLCLFSIKPTMSRAHEREALIRQRRDQFDRAISSYNFVLKSNPRAIQKERIERSCQEMTKLSKETAYHVPLAGEYIAATLRCQSEGVQIGTAAELALLADEKVERGWDKFYEEIKRGDTYEAYEGLKEALDGFFLDSRVIRFSTRKHPTTEILPELEHCLAPYEDDLDFLPDEMETPEKIVATVARYRARFSEIAQMEIWDGKAGAKYKIESMINSWCILCFIDQISGGVESINQAMTHWTYLGVIVSEVEQALAGVPRSLVGDSVSENQVTRIRHCSLECSLLLLHYSQDIDAEVLGSAEARQALFPPAEWLPASVVSDRRVHLAEQTRSTYRLKMHQARVLELKAYTKEHCRAKVGMVTWPNSNLLTNAATLAVEASKLLEEDDIARIEARYYVLVLRFAAGSLKPGTFFREFAKIESDAKLAQSFFGKLSRTGYAHFIRLRNYTDYLRHKFTTVWVTRYKLPRGLPILDHSVLTEFLNSRMNPIGRVAKDPLNPGNRLFATPAVERYSSTLPGEISLWDIPREFDATKA